LNGKLLRAACLQCGEVYEDWIVTGRRLVSPPTRDIWAAAHCERTGHVRFEIDNVDRNIVVLRHPGRPLTDAGQHPTFELDDENYGTIKLGPGEEKT
jgi:hypothetical protein